VSVKRRIISLTEPRGPHPLILRLECGHERGWREKQKRVVGDTVRCNACTKAQRPPDDGYMTIADEETWGRL
jgi:hypothetical protein